MNSLWRTKSLGDLCDILDSKRRPITKKDRSSGEFPYYGATGILDYVEDYIFDEKLVLIGEDGAKWGVGENTAFSAVGKYWVNNHAHVIRPHRAMVLDEWIIYYINANDLSPFITGLTVPKLNQAKMREIPIPLPSLPEQKRIVAILDQVFDGIAAAVANAGKSLANARLLFETHLNSVFSQKGDGWAKMGLDEIGRLQTGTTPKTSEKGNLGTYIPFIKPGDFRPDGSLDYENEGLSELGLAQSRLIPSGSALMVCIGATIGKAGFAARDISANQQVNAVTPFDGISGKLIYYQMISTRFQDEVIANSAQATLPIINKSKWGKLTITLPKAFAEQQDIVSKLDNLSVETRRLENIYQQKLSALAELKQSILQKAFAGELTAQPEKALQKAFA